MLILSRRSSESIIVGDEVTVTILSVKGKQVRIGIDAPAHIGVHREEIYQRIKEGNSEASSSEEGSSEQGSSEQGSSEQGSSEQGSSEQGSPEQSSSGQSSSGQSSSEQGSPNISTENSSQRSETETSEVGPVVGDDPPPPVDSDPDSPKDK